MRRGSLWTLTIFLEAIVQKRWQFCFFLPAFLRMLGKWLYLCF